MNNVFGSVGKQLGGLTKHVAKKVVREPLEVIETAVGESDKGDKQENSGMEAVETATSQATQQQAPTGDDSGQPKGFKTQQDYQKYQQLSGNRDQMEMAILRKKLASEWGVETGMERARQEYLQKEQEREQVEEQEKQESQAMMYEKQKKDESIQVKMAKDQASPEKRMSVAG